MQHLQKTGGGPVMVNQLLPSLCDSTFKRAHAQPSISFIFIFLRILRHNGSRTTLFQSTSYALFSSRRGVPPPVLSLSFPAPSLDRNVLIEDLSPTARNRSSVSHESRVTSHQSRLTSPCPQRDSQLTPPSCILSPGYPPLFRPGDRPLPLSWSPS